MRSFAVYPTSSTRLKLNALLSDYGTWDREKNVEVFKLSPATEKSYVTEHGAEPFSSSRQLCSYSRNFQHFIEPEGSLSCSQEPSTGGNPEPD
jgi:hypothetical protein